MPGRTTERKYIFFGAGFLRRLLNLYENLQKTAPREPCGQEKPWNAIGVVMGRDEEAKLQQLLGTIINAYDSVAFR